MPTFQLKKYKTATVEGCVVVCNPNTKHRMSRHMIDFLGGGGEGVLMAQMCAGQVPDTKPKTVSNLLCYPGTVV